MYSQVLCKLDLDSWIDSLSCSRLVSYLTVYLHKPAFAHALTKFPEEPLKSPYAASVAALSLETAVYLLAVAKSWIHIDPILCPRWWQ